MNESKSFQLNKTDLKKILKGLAIAAGGAGITYLLGVLDVIDVQFDTPLWVALLSTLLNAIKVWIQGTTNKKPGINE